MAGDMPRHPGWQTLKRDEWSANSGSWLGLKYQISGGWWFFSAYTIVLRWQQHWDARWFQQVHSVISFSQLLDSMDWYAVKVLEKWHQNRPKFSMGNSDGKPSFQSLSKGTCDDRIVQVRRVPSHLGRRPRHVGTQRAVRLDGSHSGAPENGWFEGKPHWKLWIHHHSPAKYGWCSCEFSIKLIMWAFWL